MKQLIIFLIITLSFYNIPIHSEETKPINWKGKKVTFNSTGGESGCCSPGLDFDLII